MSIALMISSKQLILYCPLLLLPSIFPSIRVFSSDSVFALSGWSIGVSASGSVSVLTISIQGWFPLGLTSVISFLFKGFSGILHYNSKASILWCSAFFTVQLSHPHMTTGKTIALIIQNFIGKVMSLRFNMLFRFVITFILRSKSLLIMASVTVYSHFGAQEKKSCQFPLFSHLFARIIFCQK